LWGVFSQKYIEIVTGIQLPYSATVGHKFYIGHFGGIIINANAVIGDNCNISQGVTIGVSGRGAHRGVPVVGDNVYIGANATIAGDITIGNNAVIGANSLVVKDVEEATTVVGVPAKVVSTNDSKGYITSYEKKLLKAPFDRKDIDVISIPAISFGTITAIFKSIIAIPIIVFRLFKAMQQADHIHLRCPATIALIASVVQLFFPSKKKTVKYAGNWSPKAKQPISYKLLFDQKHASTGLW